MLRRTPIYQQLAFELGEMIGQNVLRPGDRLPSIRRLAQERNLSLATVVQALRLLEDQGLVEARPQSGFFVKLPELASTHGLEPCKYQLVRAPVAVDINRRLLRVLALNTRSDLVLLGAAYPATALLPTAPLQKAYSRIGRHQQHLLATESYAEYSHPELVRQIVRHSLAWGKPVNADELVITNSCTEALSLCLRTVTRPGDTVAVESPSYYAMLQLLEQFGLKAIEIPTHPRRGLSVDALELASRDCKISACLLVSSFNNPLGSLVPDEEKQRLIALCEERDIPLIDDDTFGELYFGAVRQRPLKSFDTVGIVMHCASFAKTLSPTLRLGYVVAGRFQAEILNNKNLTSGTTNLVTQAVAASFMGSSEYERHLRKLRRALREQVLRMQQAVQRYFPQGTRFSEPQGGLYLWVEMPHGVNSQQLLKVALKSGVLFIPGNLFSASGQHRHCLRLNCGDPWSPRIELAIQILGTLVSKALESGRS